MPTVGKETEQGRHIDVEFSNIVYRLKCPVCNNTKFWRSECQKCIYCNKCRAVLWDSISDIADISGISWNLS